LRQAFISLLVACCPLAIYAGEVAITIDDFSIKDGSLFNIEERDQKILDALKIHNVSSALFVTCKELENPRIKKRLSHWDIYNHVVANHTYNHWHYHKTKFREYSFWNSWYSLFCCWNL